MTTSLGTRMAAAAFGLALGSACALETNPDFDGPGQGGGTEGAGTGGVDTDGGPTDGGTAGTTTGDSGNTGIDPGCTDPSICIEIHVGPGDLTCTREVDGVITDECDLTGYFGFRVAAAMTVLAGGGKIVLYDDKGQPTDYGGAVELAGGTTVIAAPGTPVRNITVNSDSATGIGGFHLLGDGVHLAGFTIAVQGSGGAAIYARIDPWAEGTATGSHLFERLAMVATFPEETGSNSIQEAIDALGPDTTVRNCHVWGYFNGTIDLRWAHGTRLLHNTFVDYQTRAQAQFDAGGVLGVEMTNNVFVRLTRPGAALVSASATSELVLTGNVIEGYTNALAGASPGGGIVVADNLVGEAPLESPQQPLFLADAAVAPSGASEAVSLDNVDLDVEPARFPGAYQQPSGRSGPRRSVIKLGPSANGCGGPCDRTQAEPNAFRLAVHDAWPGTTVELHPSPNTYLGAPIVTWPVDIVGTGATPADVVISDDKDDDWLEDHGHYASQSHALVATWNFDRTMTIENLTVEVEPGDFGMRLEGSGEYGVTPSVLVQRVRFVDDGGIEDTLAGGSVTIGDGVILRDALVRGGFRTCARLGPRSSESAETLAATAWIHHLTCRLTLPSLDPDVPIAGFEVASATQAIIADVALEMAEVGALLKAQRRTSGDAEETALDVPNSITVQAVTALGVGPDFDGFADTDGTYTLTDIDYAPASLFMSAADDHLDPASPAVDAGVDPSTLHPELSLGVDLDGVDRSAMVCDRGAYEQGV